MARHNNDDIDLYELLSRADELLEEKENQPLSDEFEPEFEESMETDDTFVYRNAANGYGMQTDQTVRFQPVSATAPAPKPAPVTKPTQAEKAVSSIRAYNADFRNERASKPAKPAYDETAVLPTAKPTPAPTPAPVVEKPKKEKKKGGCLKKLIVPIALIIALVLITL